VCTRPQGGEREAITKDEVDYSGIHFWRHHDVGRLQEEGSPTTTAATAPAAVAYGLDFCKSEQHR
jgi:hypothetical protein